MTIKTLDKVVVLAGAGLLLYDLAKRAKASAPRETPYMNAGFDSQDVFGGYDLFKSQSMKKKTY